MSEQSTDYGRYATISEQLPAIETFQYLARTFPALPSAYLTAHAFGHLGVQLLVDTGADVEAWRTALQVPADTVVLHRYHTYTSIEFETVVRGVTVKVYGSTPLAPERAELSPQEDAARRDAAALLVQRHELEDPSEPPLGGAEPQPSALERGRAEADAWNRTHPVGTAVAAYPQTREDEPLITRTRSEAWPLGHGDLVVLVEGQSGGVCLSHVDVLPAAAPPAPVVRTLADTQGGAV